MAQGQAGKCSYRAGAFSGSIDQEFTTFAGGYGAVAGAGYELPLVYAELRKLAAHKMAGERSGHTLQPTALVHEAWLRLVGDRASEFENRGHFFAAAAEAMRRNNQLLFRTARSILKDDDEAEDAVQEAYLHAFRALGSFRADAKLSTWLVRIAVNEALDRLAAQDARKAEVVKLRYFVGFSFEETAEVLGISVPTAKRDWAYARAWLHQEIAADPPRFFD